MNPRSLAAALGVGGLLLGLVLGFLVGRESAPRAAVPRAVDAHEKAPSAAPAAPDAALVDALRREIADLKAREVRLRTEALGARRPRRGGEAEAGAPADTATTPAGVRRPGTPEELLTALAQALQGRDGPALAYLRALLGEQIQNGTLPATTVVAWLRTATDPALLEHLADVLASHLPEGLPSDALGGLVAAAKSGADKANRLAALKVLNGAYLNPSEALADIRAIAEGDPSSEVRLEAMVMLSRYLSDPHLPEYREVADSLQRTARHDADPRLRAEAVMSLDLSRPGGSEGRLLLEILASDQDEDVRATVAALLPTAAHLDPGTRLVAMEERYAKDASPMVRRMLLGSIVQVGGAQSAGVLERMRGLDPTFQQDIDDYLSILRSGVTDWTEVESRKAALPAGNALPEMVR